MKKEPLKVTPKKKYKVPKYPSWQDPSPMDDPDLRYPHSREGRNAVAVASLMACMAMFSFTKGQDGGENPLRSGRDTTENPFDLKKHAGLPHHSSPFGTGLPSRLGNEVARALIEDVFSQEGLSLQQNVFYDKNGVKFVLDGYNEATGIGYIWMGWRNLDSRDAIASWREAEFPELINENDTRSEAEKTLERVQHDSFVPEALREEIKKALGLPGSHLKEDEMAKMVEKYNTFVAEYDSSHISLAEAEIIDSLNHTGDAKIALISQYDNRFQYASSWDMRVEVVEEDGVTPSSVEAEERAREPEKEAMYRLQEQVRDYIQWAKEQGRF